MASYASHPSRSYAYSTPSSSSTDYSSSSSATGTRSTSTTSTSNSTYNRYALPPQPASSPSAAKATVVGRGPRATAVANSTDDGPTSIASTGLHSVLQTFALTLALQYASAALAMPFEVAKLLLQVQYLPTPYPGKAPAEGISTAGGQEHQQGPHPDHAGDDIDPDADDLGSAYAGEARHWGGEFDELSDEDEAVAYFQDLSSQPLRPPTSRRGGAPGSGENNRPTDASGYIDPSKVGSAGGALVRSASRGSARAELADGLRPEWILPPVRDGGVWAMIKVISRSREGLLGLWKGTFASFLLEAGSGFFQPLFAQILALLTRQPSLVLSLPPSYSPSPYVSLSIQLASHLFTGLLLSPLDLVRTRLVVQSGLRAHRTYKSTWHAFQRMLAEEGGWRTAYFHPNVLIPTVLDYSLRPLLSLGAPLVIERWMGIEATNSPALYAALELTLGTASLLVSLPIETVRRRLQLQRRAAWGVLPKPVVVPLPQPTRNIPTSPSKGSARRESAAAAGTNADDASTSTATPAPAPARGRGGKTSSSSLIPGVPTLVPPTAVGTSALGIRTSVEVRPVAYAGVIEAVYRIVTEECGRRSYGAARSTAKAEPQDGAPSSTIASSSTKQQQTQLQNAADALSDLVGGLKSLYRGFGLAAAANGIVFMLTVVGGENARSASSGGLGGGFGQGSFAGGGWTEI
ncbi:hypothetical protein V8E36_003277 [Tilletia maclaganii]